MFIIEYNDNTKINKYDKVYTFTSIDRRLIKFNKEGDDELIVSNDDFILNKKDCTSIVRINYLNIIHFICIS